MNALQDLLVEVKFRERMRGYDHEEVDAYVKTVNLAAAQAGQQLASLQQRLAQIDSEAGADEGVAELRETLLRTMVLAQRTADSALSGARSEAQSIIDSAQERAAKTVSEAETAASERLRSAEERAASMLAETEESSQLIIAETKRTAAAEITSERSRAQEEIQALEATKGELETVLANIRARLEDERDTLRGLASSFQSFVETLESATDGAEPVSGSTHQPEAGTDLVGAAVPVAAPIGGVAPDIEEGGAAAGSGAAGTPAAEDPVAVDARDDGADGPGHDELELEPGGVFQETLARDVDDVGAVPEIPVIDWGDEPEPDPVNGAAAESDRAAPDAVRLDPAARLDQAADGNGAASPAPADAHASAGAIGGDSLELFDVEAEEDDEFIEQLRQVVSRDAPLPDTDAAMAVFFNHD